MILSRINWCPNTLYLAPSTAEKLESLQELLVLFLSPLLPLFCYCVRFPNLFRQEGLFREKEFDKIKMMINQTNENGESVSDMAEKTLPWWRNHLFPSVALHFLQQKIQHPHASSFRVCWLDSDKASGCFPDIKEKGRVALLLRVFCNEANVKQNETNKNLALPQSKLSYPVRLN